MKKWFLDHLPVAAFIFSILLGGLNVIGVHYTVLELSPFWGAFLRLGPASIILFTLVFLLKLPLPRGRALLGAVLFGVLNFGFSYALVYYGLRKVQPGTAQVILALVPLFTIPLAVLHRQEIFRMRATLGALIAAGGIAILCQDELYLKVAVLPLVAVIIGAVCLAEGGVVAKRLSNIHPISTSAIGMATGSIILFLMSTLSHENQILPVKPMTWIALIYLVLIGSCVVFVLFLYVLKHWPASTVSYQFVLLPFVTMTVSLLFGNETLDPTLSIGAALVLSGVLFGVLVSPAKQEVEQPVCAAC